MFKWIKRKILIHRVDKCLGIKLRKDQINCIFKNHIYTMGPRTGKTLTHILKILLNEGIYDFKNLPTDEVHGMGYRRWYFNYFRENYYKLKEKNLVQCTIRNIEVKR
jgi:hypothetical protein